MSELKQNYLRVYPNEAGTVTIVSGYEDDQLQQLNLEYMNIHSDDLLVLAKALKSVHKEYFSE